MGALQIPGATQFTSDLLVPHRPILAGWGGSMASGTFLHPNSHNGVDDSDVVAVYIGTLYNYVGLRASVPPPSMIKINNFHSTTFELRDFIHRLIRGEPQALLFLFNDPQMMFSMSQEGVFLRKARDLFISKQVYFGFMKIAKECLVAMQSPPSPQLINHEKRLKLFQRRGYDGPLAAKALLTLQIGVEILEMGKVFPHRRNGRSDFQLFTKVKEGGWTISQVVLWAEHLLDFLKKAYDTSTLQEEPRLIEVEDLLVGLLAHNLTPEMVGRRRDMIYASSAPANPSPSLITTPLVESKKETKHEEVHGPLEEEPEGPDPNG